MKNIVFITTLVIALGLIGFLYQRLSATEAALQTAQQHFADCQQVTFQLQSQLSQDELKQDAKGIISPSAKR